MTCSVFSTTLSLMQMFEGKLCDFQDDITNVHMVWLDEIQQECNRMFSSDFSAEPELMPKTPSQKKSSRRKRVSVGREGVKRRFSKGGKRSNLRRFSVTELNLIPEGNPPPTTSEHIDEEPKRSTRKNKTKEPEAEEALPSTQGTRKTVQSSIPEVENDTTEQTEPEKKLSDSTPPQAPCTPPQAPIVSPPTLHMRVAEVMISAGERRSAEMLLQAGPSETLSHAGPSPSRSACKIAIAGSSTTKARRSSVRRSFTARRSLIGKRQSMIRESMHRASKRSFRMQARLESSKISASDDVFMTSDDDEVEVEEPVAEEQPSDDQAAEAETATDMENTESPPVVKEKSPERRITRQTRAKAQNSPALPASESPSDASEKKSLPKSASSLRSRQMTKRNSSEEIQSSPPKKSHTAVKPAMRSFLNTVQKNQILMMTPNAMGRNVVIKSFIKHTTPHKIDLKEKERLKLEALKKKQELEEERKKKMEEEKRKKQEERKRLRDERLRKVIEARNKGEQRENEKKKKIEQKMAQIDEKNDKLRVERLAEERVKKMASTKRQEELEQRRKLEEETRRKKIQQAEEEEKRLQELQAKRRMEEEQERARKLAEARRAMELKREQELEQLREKQAAAERERQEREKALALQREVEKAAREKERRELEEKRKAEEERRMREEEQKRRLEEEKAKQREAAKKMEAAALLAHSLKTVELKVPAALNQTVDLDQASLLKTPAGKAAGGLNVTVDVEQSPQSYDLTPKGGNKPVVINPNPEDYGMDQNSDDSTDDESAPRKPIPSWAQGQQLKQKNMQQYYNPVDAHAYFGNCEPPKLENIFCKNKPRYFKRTSSAVWHSPPPRMGTLPF